MIWHHCGSSVLILLVFGTFVIKVIKNKYTIYTTVFRVYCEFLLLQTAKLSHVIFYRIVKYETRIKNK